MIFRWFRERRRRKLLATPFPDDWHNHLRRNVAIYETLPNADQQKLRDTLRVIVAEKTWEAFGDMVVDDEVKVTIAAQAAVLLLGFDKHCYFANVRSIIVHPSSYTVDEVGHDGIVEEDAMAVAGTAVYRGPVTLVWPEVKRGGKREDDGRNVVMHEFAHKLDMQDGMVDGTPELRTKAMYQDWVDVMTEEFERLGGVIEDANSDRADKRSGRGRSGRKRRRRASVLDRYGATNPAEFFAVATESFFEESDQLKRRHRELYDLLKTYYRQDPARWDGWGS